MGGAERAAAKTGRGRIASAYQWIQRESSFENTITVRSTRQRVAAGRRFDLVCRRPRSWRRMSGPS